MGYQDGDQYKDEYIDNGYEEGEEPAPEPLIAKYIREKKESLENLKNRKPGFCGHCNVRMRVLKAILQKNSYRVGAICPLCYDMENWVVS